MIVPSWLPDKVPSDFMKEQLIQAHSNNKLIVGLCTGAYAIAYSDLLNGKRATTHWQYGRDFAKTFPLITCDINPLYITQGNVITSAGSAAAIDCCLHIVKHIMVLNWLIRLRELWSHLQKEVAVKINLLKTQ